ncbi:filamentous hemagglutinin, partial [Agrobacterium rhizogenes]|nr:filamentous hemagglutinin [Rhizobium rhizogenes]NTH91179.1 filamentous hemagglutinin [Rhizobium rhizogenes]
QTKKSGIGVGSGGGFISIYGSHSKTISESSTDNVGSTLTAANGNINLTATAGDLNVIGSSITANMGDVTGIASGNINILPGHESTDSSKDDKRSGFGLQVSASSSGASIGIGAGRFTNKTTQSADTNAVSTITAGNDITLKAGDTFNDQAGQISAGGNVTIFGQNGVNFLSGNDVSNFDQVATSFFAGVSLGVSSGILSAGQSVQNLASKIGNVTDGYSAANAAFAGMKAYDALSSLSDGLNAGNLASISLTAGFTYSKTETSLTTSTPVVPTISASSVDISTNGDFVSRGLQISAVASSDHADDPDNGSVSISANNIDMGGAWASSEASSSSKSAGASIGVSVGVGAGSVTGITPTGSVSAGQSKSSSTSTTPVVSVVSASNGITFTSKGNTTLDNTIFSAGTIIGTVGGDLSIVSTPGTGSQSNSSQSLGFSFTGPTVGKSDDGSPLLTTDNAKTALGGLTLGGVQPGFGKGSGSTSWIDQPSGLYSTGDQTITVGGNTNLAASGLISSDGQVNLDTGTLTWSDFVGSQKYQGYQVDANIDLYSGKDANGKTQNNSSAEGKYQLDDVEQSVKATISSGRNATAPGSGAPGNITIRNTDQQAALEQSGTTRPVDQINSDPSQQNLVTKDKHIDLEPYVSVQSLQAAVIAGQTIAQAVGDAIARMTAAGALTPEDSKAAVALTAYAKDPNVLAQLASCGANHSENEYHFFDWLITPAYADMVSCPIATASGTYWVTPDGAVSCLQLFRNATAGVLGETAAATAALASIIVLFTARTAGGAINSSTTLDDGTVVQITGQGSENRRVATITTPNSATMAVVLNCYGTSCDLVSGTFNDEAMPPALLAGVASQLSRDGKMQVVYNEQSGAGTDDTASDGTEENADGERVTNPTKGESEIWKDLDNAGKGRKKSGSGSKTRYYEWDYTHNDIEVYNNKGKHLGSMNPTTGEMYKPPVPGRSIKL